MFSHRKVKGIEKIISIPDVLRLIGDISVRKPDIQDYPLMICHLFSSLKIIYKQITAVSFSPYRTAEADGIIGILRAVLRNEGLHFTEGFPEIMEEHGI